MSTLTINHDTPSRSAPRRRVAKYLYRELSSIQPGESLPSVRQIMEKCQVSQLSVQAAVKELQERKMVEVRARRGLFKTADAADIQQTDQIDVIYCGLSHFVSGRSGPHFHAELSAELTRSLGGQGRAVRLHDLPLDAVDEEFGRIAVCEDCPACIVIATPRVEVEAIFARHHVPTVHLFPVSSRVPPHSIVIDPMEVVEKQVSHLLGLGHRRIGYFHGIQEGLYHRDLVMRREHFYRMIAERGLPMRPSWVRFIGYDAATAAHAVSAMFGDADRPTAAILPDAWLPVTYQSLHSLGLEVGQDVSLVGTDDLALTLNLNPPATSLRVPRARALAMAMETLRRLRRGESVPAIQTLPVELSVRASTSVAKERP